MRYALFLLLFAALSAPFKGAGQTYTFLTYNIRLDNPGDGPDRWDIRKEALAAEVMRRHPAAVGLQEVTPPQVRFLDEKLKGYQRFGVGREDGKDKGEYSPVYLDTTVFRFVSGQTFWLSATPETPGKGWDAACERIATKVLAVDRQNGDSIWIVNTHWDHVGQEARRHSAEMIVDALKAPLQAGARVVFMGDLNSEPSTEQVKYLQLHMTEACPPEKSGEGTFNGFKLTETTFPRIDYIWLSNSNWEVVSYEVPHPMVGGRHVSDHFPVMVRLRRK